MKSTLDMCKIFYDFLFQVATKHETIIQKKTVKQHLLFVYQQLYLAFNSCLKIILTKLKSFLTQNC